MSTKKLLIVFLFISVFPAISQANDVDLRTTESDSSEVAFRSLLLSTIIVESYLAPYSFMWGVVLGGNALVQEARPDKATATWAAISLAGIVGSWAITEMIAKGYLEILQSGPQSGKPSDLRFYRVLFAGASTASILDFQGESIFEGDDGLPLWTANTPEVNTVMTFPALGYRLGASGRRWGGEFEVSLVSHHTKKQTVSYDAEGIIYIPELDAYVPLQLDQLEIPDRFLMLHSLSMGANFYIWLPKVGVRPYVGLGAQLLLNSVQSQYPGPANLALQKGKLALDSKDMGWGFHALFGFRIPFSSKKFLFAEFRPARHYFGYESGLGQAEEHDSFSLQIFDFKLGLGFYFY